MVIPAKTMEAKPTKVPKDDKFSRKCLDVTTTKATWITVTKFQQRCNLLSIMPVPAFLMYDTMDREINAMIVYERWMVFRASQKIHPFDKANTLL